MSVKLRQTINSLNLPMSLELGSQQAQGVAVDNFSGYWLKVGNDLFVPPYSLGWASNFIGSVAGGVTIAKGTPAAAVSNPTSLQDDTVIVTLFDSFINPAIGIPLLLPANYNLDYNAGSGQGTYTGSVKITKGRQIRSLNITAFVTGGTAGLFQMRMGDGVFTSDVFDIYLTTTIAVVSHQVALAPELGSPVGLPYWRVIIKLDDITGVCTYYWAYNIQYS